MRYALLFILFTIPVLAQSDEGNYQWTLPLAQQDTTITYTIGQARVDSIVYVTAQGRHIKCAVYDAEHVAARLRIGSLADWITPAEVQREVQRRRVEVAEALAALDPDVLTATEYRLQAKAIKARVREYQRTVKKGSPAGE